MRGSDQSQGVLFLTFNLEEKVPVNHPIREIRSLMNSVLEKLDPIFSKMYSTMGRPSIPPEQLLRATMLQILFSIRSERQLMEQIDYNMMFRWFVGLGIDEGVWVSSVFSKNRDRLLEQDVSKHFFKEVLFIARTDNLLSEDHFTVDGSFIEAWASQKSFKAKDGSDDPDINQSPGRNVARDFKGHKRSNETHHSITDPDARLRAKGGSGAKLVHHAHIMTENRNGLVVNSRLTVSTGRCETEAAIAMMRDLKTSKRSTIGADKGYDTSEFVDSARKMNYTPHVSQNDNGRRSRVDNRTTRHEGYGISQRRRKMVEEVFGWMKTVGGLRKTRHRGTELVNSIFEFTLATYNLVRIRNHRLCRLEIVT